MRLLSREKENIQSEGELREAYEEHEQKEALPVSQERTGIFEYANSDPIAILQQSLEQLEERRESYLEKYKEVTKATRGINDANADELQAELLVLRHEYLDAKKGYGEAMVLHERRELEQQGKDGQELDNALNDFVRDVIFQKLVIDEERLLIERKAADYPPKTVGILRRAYQRWDDLSSVKKTLIVSGIMTGLAFSATAISGKELASVDLTSTALFFSKSFLANLGQDFVSGLIGSGVHAGLTKQVEKYIEKKVENEKLLFTLDNLHDVSKRYHDLLEKKMYLSTGAMLASALAVVGSGHAYSIGIDFLGQSSLFKDVALSLSDTIKSVPDIMSRFSETETVLKPVTKILKRTFAFFKKSSHIDT